MFFKKVVSLILALLMLVGAMSGCSGTSDGDQKESTGSSAKTEELKADLDFNGETIVFVYPPGYGMVDPEGRDVAIAKRNQRIKEAEEKYNVVIEQREGRGNYWTVMATSIAAGSPAGHIMVTQAAQFLGWMKAGAFANLNEAMEKTGIDFTADHYDQTTRILSNFDGNQYGFFDVKPYGGTTWAFNKRIFEELNLENPYELVEKKEWTWEKVGELARKATKRDTDGSISVYGLGAGYYTDFLGSLAISNGSTICQFDENGSPVLTLAEPNAMAAFEQLYDWVVTDKMVRCSDGSENWDATIKDFVNGKIAIYTGGGTNMFKYAQQMSMKDDYGLVPPPIGPNVDTYHTSGAMSETYFIPKTYEDMADKLLLLFDDIYEFRDGETREDKIIDKYGSNMKDAESLKYFTNAVMGTDDLPRIYGIDGMLGIQWASPSLIDVCSQVLVKTTATPGDAVETNKVQLQNIAKDTLGDHVFTGK